MRGLATSGHEVIVFDRVSPSTLEGVRWIKGDLENLGDVISVVAHADAVVHLAAFPIPYKEVPNHVLFRNNVIGTFNVHEAAYSLGIKRVVSTSSVAVLGWPYGDREILPKYLPFDEVHPVQAQDPYALGKLCEEQIARSYALKCDMETVVLRPDRVLLPEASAQLRKQGGMRPQRFDPCGYIDVRDLASAYRQAVELPGLRHDVMFIVADDSTVNVPLFELFPRLLPDVAEMAKPLTGNRSALSNEKAKKLLKWQPRHSWRVEN